MVPKTFAGRYFCDFVNYLDVCENIFPRKFIPVKSEFFEATREISIKNREKGVKIFIKIKNLAQVFLNHERLFPRNPIFQPV